jgi:glycolate oxidase
MAFDSFLNRLKEHLQAHQIILDREALSHFSYDATEQHFMPQVVVLPESVEDVSVVMRLAHEHDIPVTPQGGRTGLSGGALPVKGGVLLSLLRMNRIIDIDEKNLQVTVEPGVVARVLQEELKTRLLFFPPDPSSTVECTIGGNVAENAGYTRAVKYGVTRDYVLGLEAVLPDGEIVSLGRKTAKNVTGYDMVSLLVGSEGTLAVITKISFKLLPLPLARGTIVVYLNDLVMAADLIVSIFRAGIVPSAIELMDNISINTTADYLSVPLRRDADALVLIEVDGHHEEEVKREAEEIAGLCRVANGVMETNLARDDEEKDRFWLARRETLPALKALGKDHLEADVVVPRYQMPLLIKTIRAMEHSPVLKIATFGHGGDGNLHITILHRRRNFAERSEALSILEEVYRKAVEMGGSLTGEHGVGITVKEYLNLQMSEGEIALMRRIKGAFDPKGILNPGKIFPQADMSERGG